MKTSEMFSDIELAIDEDLHQAYKDYWINFWLSRQQVEITETNKSYRHCKSFWDKGMPYAGVSNALFSYKLTPTSIGTEVDIRCNLSEGKEPNAWVNISSDNW